jgi:hypothetical protein
VGPVLGVDVCFNNKSGITLNNCAKFYFNLLKPIQTFFGIWTT